MRSADRLTRAERVAAKKVAQKQKLTKKDKGVVQRRMIKNLQRRGKPIPAGALPVPTAANSVSGDPAVRKLSELAGQLYGGGRNFEGTPVATQVRNAIETNNLQPREIPINFYDDEGLNKIWTGNVRIRMENERPVEQGGRGTGTVTGAGGGTGGYSSGTSTSQTDTAGVSAEGSAGGHEGAAGGKVGGSASTSTTTGSSTGTTGTGSATTGGGASADTIQRYECTIVADITLRVEADFSGTDYINPFKWGFSGVFNAFKQESASGDVALGQWTYQVSAGIAAPAAAGR
jgi:hypothetical protein